MTFFNTTSLAGEDLIACVRAAERQEVAVLAIFSAHCDLTLSPSQVLEQCERAGKRWPLTSIRRAITNLTDAQALEKTRIKTTGIYGRYEHRWKLKTAA